MQDHLPKVQKLQAVPGSWDHGKLVSNVQHHIDHEKPWNVMEHFRNERERHMIYKRNHALDRGRLDFSAPITSPLIHQLVMCFTSAGKCRTLCQMCALMLESELHELNCLYVQKNSSNRDIASSSVPTQTIFCICNLWRAGFKAVQLQDVSVHYTSEYRHSLRARQTFCQCQAKVRDSIKDDNNNSGSNAMQKNC